MPDKIKKGKDIEKRENVKYLTLLKLPCGIIKTRYY